MSRARPPSLGDYIRGLRERGTEVGGGMTRQMLATAMHTSVAYVAKLEAGRAKSPSVSVLQAISETFELTPHEVRHLYNLARQTPTERESEPVTDGVGTQIFELRERRALDALNPHPASYLDERWNLIACNSAYDELFPGLVENGNVLRWFFFGDQSRSIMVDWTDEAKLTVAWFRALMGRYYYADWAQSLLSELNEVPIFREFWSLGEVSFGRDNPLMKVRHPETREVTTLHVRVYTHIDGYGGAGQFYLGVKLPNR
ncbi:helix-turn-helix domain-containing protein [Rhodococcus sp. D-46]|uniref:helix-turn-helix transcriptional regulator n=1 Tax=Rhodococcus TaxID=1827 RepID=UPI0007E58343|nr:MULTISPECIES: helix-turn-helix transcriptional regulator [Rhodococcus erythropolis group]NHE67749.1 helix-turn-helix domain-containing protein [Rhodococcus sp. D-46]OFV75107.1 anaerobic benzoate catabolism transcriptional regulator [Rhodococcus erythropolis]